MGRKLKPTPIRHCETCGMKLERKRLPNGDLEYLIHFNRRKFCDQSCMAADFRNRPSIATSWSGAHSHARRICPDGPCVKCAAPAARDVHHKDGNFLNGSPDNLERICRSCHNREHRQRTLCVICGKPAKGHGYCNMHFLRWKKHGDPLLLKDNQFVPIRKETESNPHRICKVVGCGRGYHAHGYCGMHNQQFKRGKLLP